MNAAIKELDLKHLWVVYPGNDIYALNEKMTVVGINKLQTINSDIEAGQS